MVECLVEWFGEVEVCPAVERYLAIAGFLERVVALLEEQVFLSAVKFLAGRECLGAVVCPQEGRLAAVEQLGELQAKAVPFLTIQEP